MRHTTLAAVIILTTTWACGARADYVDTVDALSPVHWWRLGEPAGATTVTDSVGTLDGAYGSGVQPGQPGAIIGDSDTAAKFWPNYAAVPHSDDLLLDNGSISFFFRDTGSIRFAGLVSKDSSGFDTGGHLTIGTEQQTGGGRIWTRLQSTGNSWYVHSPLYQLDEWRHIVFTWGDEGMNLYFDGALADTEDYFGGLGSTSGGVGNFEPIVFGANSWGSGNLSATPVRHLYSGLLDEVMFFDYALNPTQVGDLFAPPDGSSTAVVPLPATGWMGLALLGGMGIFGGLRRRRRTA